MPSGAPTDAEYLLLAANAQLPNARLLDVGALLSFADGGPAGVFEIYADQADYVLSNLTDLDTELSGLYIAKSVLTTNGDLLVRAGGAPSRLGIGSDGQVLTVSGGAPAWAAPSGGGGVLPQPGHLSGRYYTTPMTNGTLTTFTPTINRLYMTPFLVPDTRTYDRIAAYQTASGASNYRLGIYGPFTNSYTGLSLILDSGVIATTGAGPIEATINQSLAAGWYLLAFVTDTARATRAQAQTGASTILGTTDLSASTQDVVFYTAYSFAALPSTNPGSPTYTFNPATMVFLRAA